MFDLDAALTSDRFGLILGTAAGLAVLHTLLGPDHYVPFVAMARAHDWSRRKTWAVTLACALGHVGSSVVIAALLLAAPWLVVAGTGGSWEELQDWRGAGAGWLLIGLGAAFTAWGLISALRRRAHSHAHAHADGTLHRHEHHHATEHLHVHEAAPARDRGALRAVAPWLLFVVFLFGPCESLIPLMLAAWVLEGFWGAVLVALVFSALTVATILLTTAMLLRGLAAFSSGVLERWSMALAGASLFGCGAAIRWLGL